MIARVGSMVAPFVISLKVSSEIYPPIIFGVIPIIGAVLVLFLPETRGYVGKHNYFFPFFNQISSFFRRHALPETLEDGENFGKKSKE